MSGISRLQGHTLTLRDSSLVSKTAWSAIAAASGSISRLLAGITVARLLGPESYGKVTLLFWIAEFFVLIFSLGLPSTINRFLALKLGQGEDMAARGIAKFALLAGVLLCVLALPTAYFGAGHLTSVVPTAEMTVALSLLIAAQLFSGLCQSILNGLQAFRTYAEVTIVSSIVLLLGQAFGTHNWGMNGAIYGALASYLIGTALLLRAVARSSVWASGRANSRPSIDGTALGYAKDAWFAGIISAVVWGRTEVFFLGEFSTKTEAGYFVAGLVFSSLIIQAVNLITGALLPHFSSLIGQGNFSRMENDYRLLTVFIALITVPVALGGISLMNDIIVLVLGQEYAGAAPAAQWLMGTGLLAFASVGSSVIYAYGDTRFIRNCAIAGAILLTSSCLLLAPTMGAQGVALARFFVQASMIVAGFYLVSSRYGIPLPLVTLGKILAAGIFSAIVASFSSDLVGGGLFGIAGGVVCGAVAYLVLVRNLSIISEQDNVTLSRIFARSPAVINRIGNLLLTSIRIR